MKESKFRILFISFIVALFFSFIVSSSVSLLKDRQEKNIRLDRLKHILSVAGDGYNMKIAMVDMRNGDYSFVDSDDEFYKNFRMLATGGSSIKLSKVENIIGVGSYPSKMPVYIFYDDKGVMQRMVLLIYGNGLWSTMYGFIGLEKDLATVSSITFYDQKETPGLGGEVDNPSWKALWKGKKIYDDNGDVTLSVKKGGDGSLYSVDGLSGATMTTKGVDNIIKFWFGDNGYRKFFKKFTGEKNGN
ncbi:MAG: NADH:ubiquinone reductase (Na(+)-transporting) subunit C [Calditerrivibrio sp.]|nr:NADH:ubiquinone reductase (Na(+)-transporting) subunit C [Calditerrivibrio sp.]MCA1932378.1 NADH:ubiquinone reductase (Na(+)-transporting) subunit C [Calditerrivibrio sp.]MCA1980878.1 NADH:ubiquinone reductase (Na(+)-transporting) subunit C [Calditerrivibrio sp.]